MGMTTSKTRQTSETSPIPSSSSSRLEANLSALGPQNHAAADAIRSSADLPIELETAEDGRLTGVWQGRRLASARRPGEETARLIGGIDYRESACIVVAGFGLGDHVEMIARRLGRTGVLLVLETDTALLKAVMSRFDLTDWFNRSRILLRVDENDAAGLALGLRGFESILMLGTSIIEHPPSRNRLSDATAVFTRSLVDITATARTSIYTALTRCSSTIENQLSNLDRYAIGSGIEDLAGIAAGRLGVVVSAGPSLRKNLPLLAAPGVRDRCVIVATQTTLKPLLAAGVAPHFVTALDYHPISRRFYEGIDPAAVEDTELIIDSKVHRAVPAAWPGRIRCIPSPELDQFLGPLAAGHPPLEASATVAHLAYVLARHLGCDPVALIGQDLGFTDGLYYAPGTAIHDVWLPELNAFNTIETMEWERIVRHRTHLAEREDVHGRRIFTDAQMLNYLQLFEMRFTADVASGLTVIDATEGGVRKAGSEARTLADTLATHAGSEQEAVDLPRASEAVPAKRSALIKRLEGLATEIREVSKASDGTLEILRSMLADQHDERRMNRLFDRLATMQTLVAERESARKIIDVINQVGVYKRMRADRRIELSTDLEPHEKQRAEIERDIVNVEWTRDASDLLVDLIDRTGETIRTGEFVESAPDRTVIERTAGIQTEDTGEATVIAVVPVDPAFGGTGVSRSLGSNLADRSIFRRTVERLGTATGIKTIVLLVPDDFDVENAFDRSLVGLPVEIRRCGASVFGPEHEAIRIARAVAPTSWRGGIHGLTAFDEVLAPGPTAAVMEELDADAALLVGPDWSLLPITGRGGVDELVQRFTERPRSPYVFTQGPPGLAAMIVGRSTVHAMANRRSRFATVGHLLGYRSERPQGDQIVGDLCVSTDSTVRSAIGRFTADSPRQLMRIGRAIEPLFRDDRAVEPDAPELAVRMEHRIMTGPLLSPQFLRVELTTGRVGVHAGTPHAGEIQRAPMEESTFRRIVEPLGKTGDSALFLDGVGDPLLHPRFDEFIEIAIDAGVRVVSLRTDLAVSEDIVDRLLATRVGVVEVDLDAETAETHRLLHGPGHFERVISNLERLIAGRRRLGPSVEVPLPIELDFALPWIVPRCVRRVENIAEIPEFFERWRRRLGVAVIDGPVRWPESYGVEPDPLSDTWPPARYDEAVNATRMTILADGSAPSAETDLFGTTSVGKVGERSLHDLWQDVVQIRRRESDGRSGTSRPFQPARS
ncbi:MAG: DUF115 domain-containing protein [Phycisphaera sp. TMED9]|nr:MAG: DUF115 domain-containing protein [Phycisphaera sp. TMED9]